MKPIPFSLRLVLFSLLIACVSVVIAIWLFYFQEKRRLYESLCEQLLAVSLSVTAGLNGDEHEKVHLAAGGHVENREYFHRARVFMDGVAKANALSFDFGSPIYTLRPVSDHWERDGF